jgi:hypothetical protein
MRQTFGDANNANDWLDTMQQAMSNQTFAVGFGNIDNSSEIDLVAGNDRLAQPLLFVETAEDTDDGDKSGYLIGTEIGVIQSSRATRMSVIRCPSPLASQ